MLRLQEKPVEWIKFTAVMGIVVNAVVWLLWRQDRLPIQVPVVAACGAALALVLSIIRPRWFRGFYRTGMTVSFHIGQVMGKVLLTLIFFLVVTPLGLVLRLLGKDLLELKQSPARRSGWHPAKTGREFDRMF